MRRGTRRSLVHLVFFCSLLFSVLYLTHPRTVKKTYAWNAIRYKTTATRLPEVRGICPRLADSSKPALVVARVAADGDTTWLHALTDRYHLCIYTVDAPLDASSMHLQVPANRGHEAMAYLTFLIDNYAYLPAAGAVFVHGSRWAWHNDAPDYDNAALLAALNVTAALEPWGYYNMRCDWSVSTCLTSSASQGSLETSLQAMLVPWDARAVSDAALPHALAVMFGGDESIRSRDLLLGRSNVVRSQCCAQFVVARESVWQHSRDEYVALRQWLLDGSIDKGHDGHVHNSNAAPSDDRVAGRILSYIWHILFIKSGDANAVDLERLNKQACPYADECYCRLYKRCKLKGCTSPGSCYAQYSLPQNFRLPDDWAATHS